MSYTCTIITFEPLLPVERALHLGLEVGLLAHEQLVQRGALGQRRQLGLGAQQRAAAGAARRQVAAQPPQRLHLALQPDVQLVAEVTACGPKMFCK